MITQEIFAAFLNCESKAYFKSLGQSGDSDELVNWQRENREKFRLNCHTRLRSSFSGATNDSQTSRFDALKRGQYGIFFDCTLEAGNAQTRIDAIERLRPTSRMKHIGYIPIRFVPNEKINRQDKVLLAFDAYVLALILGTTPTLGKIMHGRDQRTVTVRLGSLTGVVRSIIEKIFANNGGSQPPQLVLNKHCVECEFKARCREIAEQKDDLSLLPGIGQPERKRLHNKGIFSVQQLSFTFRPRARLSISLASARNTDRIAHPK